MAKILAIPYGHALSHVSRPLRLAEELRQRGHEVLFAGGGTQLLHVHRAGFEVREIPELPHDVLFGRIRSRKLRFIETRELQDLVAADLSIIDAVKPDLVLTDGRIGARISTRVANVSHAAIVNVSSTHHRAIPYVPLFDWIPWKPLREACYPFNLWFEMAVFDRGNPAFREVARRHRTEPVATATNCLEGNDLTLLPDIPEFMPSRGLPHNHHYVGPLTFKADLPDPPWWPELQARKKAGTLVVYFTLGTTGTKEVFESVVDELALRDDVTAIISTGGQLDALRPPKNAFLAPYLDGDKVLAIADSVICHGGNGTIYQALAHGVPVIGVPTIPDQEYNMRRVQALGLGSTWRNNMVLPFSRLYEMTTKDEHIQTRVDEMMIAAESNPSVGADLLETV